MGFTIGFVGGDSDGNSVSGVDQGCQALFTASSWKKLLMRALRGF